MILRGSNIWTPIIAIAWVSISAFLAFGQATVGDAYHAEMEQFERSSPEYLLTKLKLTDILLRVDLKDALQNAVEVERLAEELNDPDLQLAASIDRKVIEATQESATVDGMLDLRSMSFSPEATPEIKAHVLVALLEHETWTPAKTNLTMMARRIKDLELIRSQCEDQDLVQQIDVAVSYAKKFRLDQTPRMEYLRLQSYRDSPMSFEAQIICKLIEATFREHDPTVQWQLLEEAQTIAERSSNNRYLMIASTHMHYHIRETVKEQIVPNDTDEIPVQRELLHASIEAAELLNSAPLLFDRLLELVKFESQLGDSKLAESYQVQLEQLSVPIRLQRKRELNLPDGPLTSFRLDKPYERKWERIVPTVAPNQSAERIGDTNLTPKTSWSNLGSISLFVSSMIGLFLVAWVFYRKNQTPEDSENKHQENRKQRLESLVRLASGVAHDFNNSLTGVIGNAEVIQIKNQKNQDEFTRQRLSGIIKSAEQAASLSRDMLSYAGKASVNRAPQNINRFVSEMFPQLRSAFSARNLHFKPYPSPLYADVDCQQLQIALQNLVQSAVSATGEHGNITVRTGVEKLSDVEDPSLYGIRRDGGEFCFVEVEDDGHGIPEQDCERVFDPFFTNFAGNSKGLGLSRVLGIAIGHHGFVRCQSIEQKGSTFRILMPINEPTQPVSRRSHRLGEKSRKTEKERLNILIVDDQPAVRELCVDVLEPAGHQLTVVNDGRQGLDRILANPKQFDCVFLDVQMPVMTGSEVLRHLEERNVRIDVIVMTGYSEEGMDVIQGFENVQHVMTKPLSIVAILNALNRLR